MKKSTGERIFDTYLYVSMFFLAMIWIYPFIYISAISLNEAADSAMGGIYFFPRKFSLDSYKIIFLSGELFSAFNMSVARTVLGAVVSLICSSMFAYTFTRNDFIIYKQLKFIFFLAMFIGGGALIPTYMLYRSLHILNKFWVYILPAMLNLWHVVLFRTFYMQLPKGLEEVAYIDGANELQVYLKVMLPLSLPMIATVGLFNAVGQWNSWRDTLFFANREELKTLQFRMMEILLRTQSTQMIREAAKYIGGRAQTAQTADPQSVRMAITMVTTIPIILVYPFLQKYFIKGMLIGSMKG